MTSGGKALYNKLSQYFELFCFPSVRELNHLESVALNFCNAFLKIKMVVALFSLQFIQLQVQKRAGSWRKIVLEG